MGKSTSENAYEGPLRQAGKDVLPDLGAMVSVLTWSRRQAGGSPAPVATPPCSRATSLHTAVPDVRWVLLVSGSPSPFLSSDRGELSPQELRVEAVGVWFLKTSCVFFLNRDTNVKVESFPCPR